MTKTLASIFALFAAMPATAAVGDINCVAKQYEVTPNALKDYVEKPLTVENKSGTLVVLSTEINGRGYVLNGDTATGDFLLTQAWGPDYTTGFNASGSLNSQGRLAISMVEVTKVFKLECTKTLASDFPRE